MRLKTGCLGRDGASQPTASPQKAIYIGVSSLQCFLEDVKDLSIGTSVFGCQPQDREGPAGSQGDSQLHNGN